jgi:hypothetical protein
LIKESPHAGRDGGIGSISRDGNIISQQREKANAENGAAKKEFSLKRCKRFQSQNAKKSNKNLPKEKKIVESV